MDNNGLTKLIFSNAFDTTVDVSMRLIEDPALLIKSAATIFGCEYADILPDADHIGIHVVALGDFEKYGSNRNGDSFPSAACLAYHDTFVKHGNLYRHHRNKDPKKRLGQIVKSAYNQPMGRIELFVHAHKTKAEDELQKLATDGEIPFSMACRVPFDRCSICNTLRKSSKDPHQCEHVLMKLGALEADGRRVCVHNDTPNFFDLSFVTRPADRIAWDLKMASGEVVDSVKLAEAAGIWVPDTLVITSKNALEKLAHLQKMSEFEVLYKHLATGGSFDSSTTHYLWELRKAAADTLDDDTLDELRKFEPADTFAALAKAGVVLDPVSFFKYATGGAYEELVPVMPELLYKIARLADSIVTAGTCQTVCNETYFDTDPSRRVPVELTKLAARVASDYGFGEDVIDQRIIGRTVQASVCELNVDTNTKMSSNSNEKLESLATKYAAYKLAAIEAIVSSRQNTDPDVLLAVATAQNMAKRS